LCSDGLTTMVRPEEIANILGREPDPKRAAQLLVDAANAAGGEDNVTAVIIEAVEVAEDAVPVVPVGDDGEGATATGTRPPRRRRRTGRTLLRVALWALPILLVLAVAFAFVGWYARNTYYVGVDRGRVTVFQGVKGGFLIWDPTIDRRTTIDAESPPLTGAQLQDIKDGKKFSSRSEANAYVTRLRQRVESTTTTTLPPEATTPTAPPPS